MTVTLTKVTGGDFVVSNKRVRTRDVAFTSTYPDGGESVTAADVGLKKIEFVTFSGPALSTDRETSNALSYDYTNSKIIVMESGASGAAEAEKTDSEAHATGSTARAEFRGY